MTYVRHMFGVMLISTNRKKVLSRRLTNHYFHAPNLQSVKNGGNNASLVSPTRGYTYHCDTVIFARDRSISKIFDIVKGF